MIHILTYLERKYFWPKKKKQERKHYYINIYIMRKPISHVDASSLPYQCFVKAGFLSSKPLLLLLISHYERKAYHSK